MESIELSQEANGVQSANASSNDPAVILHRTEDGFSATFRDSEAIYLSENDVSRSSCLSTSYETGRAGDRVPLSLSWPLFQQWHRFPSTSMKQRDNNSSSAALVAFLVNVLEAADFLDDRDTLEQASCNLASLALPTSTAPTNPAGLAENGAEDMEQAAQHAQQAARALQVVEALPEHLALLTLRAALAAVPPDVRRGGPAATACIDPEALVPPRRRQAALCALMALLPVHLHHLVISALNPGAHDRRTLTLALPELREAEPITRAAAAAPQLTALRLIDCSWQRSGAVYGVDVHREHVATRTAVNRVIKPVATLSSLRELHVELARTSVSPAIGGWVEACAVALGAVLRWLPQLTSLRVRAWSRCGRAVQQIAPSLTVMRELRALDLSHNGLVPMQCVDAPLRVLGATLRELTALTHLCLARNWVGENGWADLEPAVAALPLRSLDLEQCELGDELTLMLPGQGGHGHGAVGEAKPQLCPFSGLRRLCLSGNHFTHSSLPFVSHMPHLTELTLARVLFSAEGYLPVLERMRAPGLEVLELGPAPLEVALAAGPPSPAAAAITDALGGCMARCCGLRRVVAPGLPVLALAKMLRCLAGSARLRELDLARARFERGEPQEDVAAALAACSGLTALTMLQLHGEVTPEPLWGAIGSLTALQRLEVGSMIGSTVCVRVAVLARLPRLTRLHLSSCDMWPETADAALAEALACMPAMRELVLHRNTMSVDGFQAVLGVLPALCALSVLALVEESMTHEHRVAVLRVLPALSALRVLSLGLAKFSDEFVHEVVQAAPRGVEHLTFS